MTWECILAETLASYSHPHAEGHIRSREQLSASKVAHRWDQHSWNACISTEKDGEKHVTTTKTFLPMLVKNMHNLISEVSELKVQVDTRLSPSNKHSNKESTWCWEGDQTGHVKKNFPEKKSFKNS